MTRFVDQCAVISGASGAIGSAVARLLAAEGCRCVLNGRSAETLTRLADELESQGSSPAVVCGDLTDEETSLAIAEAAADCGGATIVVHALGLFIGGSVIAGPVADLDRQMAVNLRAPWLLTQALLPDLVARQGQLVFVNSSAGLDGGATTGAYAASKHALRAMADSLRAEVNSAGVRVLTVYPGRTASRMQEAVCEHFDQPYDPAAFMQPDDVARTILEALALGRSAEITDIRMRPMIKLV